MDVIDLAQWRQRREAQPVRASGPGEAADPVAGAVAGVIDEGVSAGGAPGHVSGDASDASSSAEPRRVLTLMLARADRTAHEARSRLRERGFAPHEIEDAIDWAEAAGYLDDRRCGERVLERAMARGDSGRRGLSQKLAQRGVPRELIAELLADVSDDDETERAVELARQRRRRFAGLAPEVAERRLAGFLARRGFSSGAIRSAIEQSAAPVADD